MDGPSILCVVVGILIIVSRGPLLFAPNATIRFYEHLIFSTNTRVRTFGVLVGILAVSLLLLPFEEGGLAEFLHGFGWLVMAAALGILLLPHHFRRLLLGVFRFLERSVEDAVLRFGGLLAVLIGLSLVYLGIYVL